MANFLVLEDIYRIYPKTNWDRMVGSETGVSWEKDLLIVIEDISGYLRARYDVDLIFAPVYLYDIATGYSEDDRVYDNTNKIHYLCIADAVAGTSLSDTDYYTQIDDRNQKIVEITVDVLLYNMLTRLNPVDMPINRKERYDGNSDKHSGGAIGWLKLVAAGRVQPDLPLIEANQEDQSGNKIMYGDADDVKTDNLVF